MGATPLYIASKRGDTQVVDLLLVKDASCVNVTEVRVLPEACLHEIVSK